MHSDALALKGKPLFGRWGIGTQQALSSFCCFDLEVSQLFIHKCILKKVASPTTSVVVLAIFTKNLADLNQSGKCHSNVQIT